MRLRPFWCVLVVCLFLTPGLIQAKDKPPIFKSVQLKHFTIAEGVELSPDFVKLLDENLRTQLMKYDITAQVLDEGGPPSESDAGAVVLEGTITVFKNPGHMNAAPFNLEATIYGKSDHKQIASITPKQIKLVPGEYKTEDRLAKGSAEWIARLIQKAMK